MIRNIPYVVKPIFTHFELCSGEITIKNEKRFSIPTILIMTGISLVLSVGFSYLKNKDLSRLADGCYIISIILIAYGIIDLWSPTPLSRPKDIMRGIRHEPIHNGKADLNALLSVVILLIIATIVEML